MTAQLVPTSVAGVRILESYSRINSEKNIIISDCTPNKTMIFQRLRNPQLHTWRLAPIGHARISRNRASMGKLSCRGTRKMASRPRTRDAGFLLANSATARGRHGGRVRFGAESIRVQVESAQRRHHHTTDIQGSISRRGLPHDHAERYPGIPLVSFSSSAKHGIQAFMPLIISPHGKNVNVQGHAKLMPSFLPTESPVSNAVGSKLNAGDPLKIP